MALKLFRSNIVQNPGTGQPTTQVERTEDFEGQLGIEERRKRLRSRGLRVSIMSGGESIKQNVSGKDPMNISSGI